MLYLAKIFMSLPNLRHQLLTPFLLALFTSGLPSAATAQAGMLKQRLGTPMLVENRADADRSLGMDALVKAAPDGSTTGF